MIQLRVATMADAQRLFDWRNDPETRANSISPEPVIWENHLAWLEASLPNPNRQLFVAERDGLPVGTLRADTSDDQTELSWTVAPASRGQGIGRELVAAGIAYFPGSKLVARIKKSNLASLRIVVSLGFHQQAEVDGLTIWQIHLQP